MKLIDLKHKDLWGLSMAGLLGISYWVCRFLLFDMHGMKQWPDFLAVLSAAIIIIASLSGNRIVSAAAVTGYMGGFVLSMIFNTDGTDPGGGRTNNAWIIWGGVLLLLIMVGITFSIIYKHIRTNKEKSA